MTAEPFVISRSIERRRLIHRAILLELAIISYNLFEGIISIVAGVLAGSIALVGFGIDSSIELSAGVVVLVHLWQGRGEDEESSPWERRIAVWVGVTLLALALYVGGRAVWSLTHDLRPDESYLGIAIAVASMIIMPSVSRLQLSLAKRMNCLALAADSRETMVCSMLSASLLLGLVANAALGWWWADPIAGLVIAAFALREGVEAIRNKELVCID